MTYETKMPVPATVDEDSIDLSKWLVLLWSRRYHMLLISLSFAVIAAICTFFMTPTYISTAKLILPPAKGEGGVMGMLSQLNITTGLTANSGGVESSEFYKEIIESRVMADHLIQKLDLKRTLKDKNDTEEIQELKIRIQYCFKIRNIKGGFFEISTENSSPEMAHDLLHEAILTTNDIINRLNIIKAKEKRQFLEHRIQDVNYDLLDMQNKIKKFYESRNIFVLDEQSRRSIESASQLLNQIETLHTKRGIQGASIGTDHPDYLATVREIQEVSKRFHRLMTGSTGENTLTHPPETEVMEFSPLFHVAEIPDLHFKNLELSRDMAIQANLLAMLRQQYEMAKIEEKKEDLFLRVLDPPDVPIQKASPQRRKIVLISLLVGFFISFSYISISERHNYFKLSKIN